MRRQRRQNARALGLAGPLLRLHRAVGDQRDVRMTQAAILFDLDGTLIDSAPDLHASAGRLLVAEGLNPLSLDQIRAFIGNGVPKLVERIIGATDLDMSEHQRLVARFLEDYNTHAADLTRPYPGALQALDRLAERGFALGLVTNKPETPARAILDVFGMDQYFGIVIGGDTLSTKKPDPAGLLHGFAELWGTSRLYVGDSEVDAEAASRADVAFGLYTPGYRKSPVAEIPHHFAFDSFDDLPSAAEALLLDTARV